MFPSHDPDEVRKVSGLPMLKVTIESTSKKDNELIPFLLMVLCYGITDEQCLELDCPQWSGHSGGSDAYDILTDKKVKVVTKEKK